MAKLSHKGQAIAEFLLGVGLLLSFTILGLHLLNSAFQRVDKFKNNKERNNAKVQISNS